MSIVVDTRGNSNDKTSTDRQRFLRRARGVIKDAVKKAISEGDIRSLQKGRVIVPVKGMGEPSFRNDRSTGKQDHVHPGNREFSVGDLIPKPKGNGSGSGGGNQSSQDGEGEDEFTFSLTPEEFFDFMYDDLDLPYMIKQKVKQIKKVVRQRAGFTNSGNPATLDYLRTYSNSLIRHFALSRPTDEEIALKEWEYQTTDYATEEDKHAAFALLQELKDRQKAIPLIDDYDLKFRSYPPVPKPTSQAVVFMCMDVSGSMDEERKDIAKRFFLFLYVLLKKKYDEVQIVFIRHHSRAEECNEEDFFHKKESGGTVVSSYIELVSQILDERFDADWNVYVAHASDGDNYDDDNAKVSTLLPALLPRVQYMAYLEVVESPQNLWHTYLAAAEKHKHLAVSRATGPEGVWPVFRKLFSSEAA